MTVATAAPTSTVIGVSASGASGGELGLDLREGVGGRVRGRRSARARGGGVRSCFLGRAMGRGDCQARGRAGNPDRSLAESQNGGGASLPAGFVEPAGVERLAPRAGVAGVGRARVGRRRLRRLGAGEEHLVDRVLLVRRSARSPVSGSIVTRDDAGGHGKSVAGRFLCASRMKSTNAGSAARRAGLAARRAGVAIVVAGPHRAGDVGRVADEPRVLRLVRRARLAGDGPPERLARACRCRRRRPT